MPLDKVRNVLQHRQGAGLPRDADRRRGRELARAISSRTGRRSRRPTRAVYTSLEEQTRKVLATLTPREEQILRMRFGIGEKSDYTLEEVGQRFAVTRERIRQIEAKALAQVAPSEPRPID